MCACVCVWGCGGGKSEGLCEFGVMSDVQAERASSQSSCQVGALPVMQRQRRRLRV